ncbi:S8 family serine peptidase [Hypericibacter sp.]|uniref:S8 family serine peptidase n=1 Tax=Hypericibacter sp. TaxID=2705401 RepID=UPI003D6D0E56
MDDLNPWDACHSLLQGGLGIAGTVAPIFAEPDFPQRWPTGRDDMAALAAAGECVVDPQDPRFPVNPDPFWFKDDQHGQFTSALGPIKEPIADRVRVAHLDTGYDADQDTLPRFLNRDLQRNFVDSGRPNDARDDSDGPLNNLGHGTGTLSLLAGKTGGPNGSAMGAAPFVEVVPIRVANRVVLFYNSAIAQGLDYVHELCTRRNAPMPVHVVTMSMGGLASQAWAEAVNALYDAGVFIVTAAGNNYGNLPTRNIVYPARFKRVVAACGAMVNGKPYADLPLSEMAGNYGPDSKMDTAIAAFTPNTPWAKLGCAHIVDLDGAGTSAATPQVAAAAAIWIQRNKQAYDKYPQAWMRVEAVRAAMFGKARNTDRKHFGRGELAARDAAGVVPTAASLKATPEDSASFAFLRTLTGLGLQPMPAIQQRMIELEALQLSQSARVEAVLSDPEAPLDKMSEIDRRRVIEAIGDHPQASKMLRDALGRAGQPRSQGGAITIEAAKGVEKLHLQLAVSPPISPPTRRRLRVYAYDPSLGTHLDTIGINQAVLDVRWEEKLEPGPVGEYLEVIDVDPASGYCYAPVNLNNPYLLVRDGLTPSESNPQFHQQMAYAVAMKTIEYFEQALGRVALWSPRTRGEGASPQEPYERYVQRLRIYPHALRVANAYYSPERKALLLGYFAAVQENSGDVLPGGLVFAALSHDIVAHETSHALLDGLHRRYRESTNPDMLAFHEAFADIVALFQHFTVPEALRSQITKTRGDLGTQSLLAQLAVQFGQATGRYGALRNAISHDPKRDDYEKATEAHDRGAVLVAAVFGAFLHIYEARTADLIRLATGGSGILPQGAISTDLMERLAREASKVAGQVLRICIRALDYCPPVDLTFGEYLRALITADRDMVPDDDRGYRVAFVSAFRDRGIYPAEVKSLSVGSLVWEPPPLPLKKLDKAIDQMNLGWDLQVDRESAYNASRDNAVKMHDWLMKTATDEEISALGLFRKTGNTTFGGVSGKLRRIEVHSVRPARRVRADGQSQVDLVVEITQGFQLDPPNDGIVRGGCTILIDLGTKEVRYFIRKRVDSPLRIAANLALADEMGLAANYYGAQRAAAEPFAMLHRTP